jgi:hypothetical protein
MKLNFSEPLPDGSSGKNLSVLASETGWKAFTEQFAVAKPTNLSVNFQNGAIGESKAFYFRNLKVVRVAGPKEGATSSKNVSPVTSANSPVVGAQVNEATIKATIYVAGSDAKGVR